MGNSASTNGSPAKQKRGSKLFNRKKRRHSEHPNDSANSGKTERNYDWVLDCVVEYIQSGECSVYVDGFIDEHCLVFDANHNPLSPTKPNRDDDQEAKEFEYRQIHAQYKDMIESLLVLHLTKLGLTAKQFTDACQCASAQKDSLNSSILRYIHAINDFELFKRIMCERNMELEREAMKYLSQPAPLAATKPSNGSTKYDGRAAAQVGFVGIDGNASTATTKATRATAASQAARTRAKDASCR